MTDDEGSYTDYLYDTKAHKRELEAQRKAEAAKAKADAEIRVMSERVDAGNITEAEKASAERVLARLKSKGLMK